MAEWFQKNKEELKLRNNRNRNAAKREKKIRAVNLLGGKCCECGYNKCIDAFDFHHTNPDAKEIDIGQLLKRPWHIIEKRLAVDDIELVCSNCHREIHAEMRKNGKDKI